MNSKTLDLIYSKLRVIAEETGEDIGGLDDAGADIAQPDPSATPPEETQPLTSKGEEYLLKMAYLALLYTPKDDEIMQINSTFQNAGINSEQDIRAEDPQSITAVKDIITSLVSTGDNTSIANDLNEVPS